jgi:predicted transcriptional regulator
MAKGEPWTIAVLGQAAESPSKAEGALLGPRLTTVIARAISDEFCVRILSSTVLEGKTVNEICEEEGIPQSTCYRRIRNLVDEGVLVIEKIVVAPTGRKYAIFRNTFYGFEVRLENGTMSVYATLNPAVADKLRTPFHRLDSSRSSPQNVAFRHASGRPSTSRSGVF